MAAVQRPRRAASKHVLLAVHVGAAREVSVTGDFTKWSADGIPLLRGPQGDWHVTLKLAPGSYQYRLLVDGTWRDDPCASTRVPNPYGTENCVLVVQ